MTRDSFNITNIVTVKVSRVHVVNSYNMHSISFIVLSNCSLIQVLLFSFSYDYSNR